MTFEIRKGIPKPIAARGPAAGNTKYPFGGMEVGDSFIIAELATKEAKRKAASAINTAHKRFPTRVYSQRVDAAGALGVWRDADLVAPRVKRNAAKQALSL